MRNHRGTARRGGERGAVPRTEQQPVLGAVRERERAPAHGAARPRLARGPSPRHITLSEARSRLYQRRSLQPNSHFATFFKIFKISSRFPSRIQGSFLLAQLHCSSAQTHQTNIVGWYHVPIEHRLQARRARRSRRMEVQRSGGVVEHRSQCILKRLKAHKVGCVQMSAHSECNHEW